MIVGTARASAAGWSGVAAALLLAAFALYGLLLVRLRRYETALPATPWWFGYARDGVNLGATLAAFGGFVLGGFTGPMGLALGMAVALVAYGLDYLLGKRLALRAAAWLAPGCAVAIAFALLALERPLAEAVGGLLLALAPR